MSPRNNLCVGRLIYPTQWAVGHRQDATTTHATENRYRDQPDLPG